MDFKMEMRSRQLAREKVMQELLIDRDCMVDRIKSHRWGNRFYRDITKEADSDGPPPTKDPELWTWPRVESGVEDHTDDLAKSLCDLDDDWSGIVKMVFLMLDCYHGAHGYISITPDTINTDPRHVVRTAAMHNKGLGYVLLLTLDRDGLAVLQKQLRSRWLTDLLTGIRTTALLLDPTGEHRNADVLFQSESVSDPLGQILAIIDRMLGSLDGWTRETLRHETFCFDGRVLSTEAVTEIERLLSWLCRCLGQSRREEWVDEEMQKAAGHLIVVRAA